ncbi:MAG: hypothetical protein J6R52_04785 [Alphaproteobacteria bacterium]|nr:hypothetical protein [Alphaproteobacteria bacterium]
MAVPLIPVIARFLGGFLVKQGTKTVVKQGAKTVAKKTIKKAAAKKVTKTAAKKAVKKAAAKKAVRGVATTVGTTGKKNIFNKAISKLGLIGGTAWGVSELFQTAGSVLSTTLTSSGFVVPAVLGAAAGTYGFYKISKITRNKSKQDNDQKKNDTTQAAFVEYSEPVPLEKMSPKHLRQIKKLSPAQIQALRAKKYKRATAKLEKEGTQLENSKKLQNVLRARQYENAA